MSRTRIGSLLGLLAIVLLLIAALPTVLLAESTPMLTWGAVTLDSAAAPAYTTVVVVYIGADTTPSGSFTVTTAGQYGAFIVEADSSRYGEDLTYKVNGIVATKSGPDEGVFGLKNQIVNLEALSSTSPTPTATPTPTVLPSNAPDFMVWDIWTVPAELCTGGSVCIYTMIENIGTVDAVDIFRTNIYLDGILKEKIDIRRLESGIRKTLTCEYTILWPSDTDWHEIKVIVDGDGFITEANESNNEYKELFEAVVCAPSPSPTPTPTSTPTPTPTTTTTPTPTPTTTPTPTPTPTTTPTPTITPTPTPTPTPPPFKGEGIVGISGGTVTTSDGKVSLAFPQGAFTSNTIVTIASSTCRTAPEGYSVHGTCFSIATSPSVAELSEDAVISVKYSTADWNAAGRDPDRLKLAYYSDGEWNVLDTTVDTTSVTASAQTDHLSEWAVLATEEDSAWQWWYTLLIVLGFLIIITAIVLLVVLPRKEKTDEVPEDEPNGDEFTVLPKSEKTDGIPEDELNGDDVTVLSKSEKTDGIPEDELNGDDVTALVNEEKNNGISYKALYVDEKGQKPTEIPQEELQQEEEDEF